MQVNRTVEATIKIEVLVNEDRELETYTEWGSKTFFDGYTLNDHLKQLPQGKYEVIITAKLIED